MLIVPECQQPAVRGDRKTVSFGRKGRQESRSLSRQRKVTLCCCRNKLLLFPPRQVPESQLADGFFQGPGGRGQQAAVGGERNHADILGVTAEHGWRNPRIYVPKPNRVIEAPGGKRSPVRRKRDGGDQASVLAETLCCLKSGGASRAGWCGRRPRRRMSCRPARTPRPRPWAGRCPGRSWMALRRTGAACHRHRPRQAAYPKSRSSCCRWTERWRREPPAARRHIPEMKLAAPCAVASVLPSGERAR